MNTLIEPLKDGAIIHGFRRGKKTMRLRLGPNMVHAFITRKSGEVIDLGITHNLLTTVGRDLWAAAFGQDPGFSGAATATSSTSMTDSGQAWSSNKYKGWRVFMPVTGLTTPAVYGNIGSNTGTVLTVDQWWTAADGSGTTPAGTNSYVIYPVCIPRFMALTTDSAAANASDTVLASEITTGGCSRTKATYAHTPGNNTYTMQVVFSVTATFTAIHKMSMFTASNITAAGVMPLEAVLNQDATVGNGDTLTVTDTITLSG